MAKSTYRKRRKRSIWQRLGVVGTSLIGISLAILVVCIIALVVSNIRLSKSKEPETIYVEPTIEPSTQAPSKNYVGNKNVVVLDPGHGGTDGGAVSGNVLEKENCLTIALLVRQKLQAAGVKVYMTRDTDITVSKERRVEIANATDACLFVSIHRNSHPSDPGARGIEAWIEKSGLDADYLISNKILNQLNSLFANKNRGVFPGSTNEPDVNYYVNGHTNMNSTLIELGFVTNAEDNAVVMGNADGCATAIAAGILEYLATLD